MIRADGVLRVVLTGKWFDMIERGEKMEDYRGSHWFPRLIKCRETYTALHNYRGRICDADPAYIRAFEADYSRLVHDDFHPYHTLIISRGHKLQTLTRKIKRIRWGTPRPEWSGDTVTGQCFIIELEEEK